MFELQVGEFSGPLEKLLELIEAEKLGINEVSLTKVTDGFLAYLEEFKKTAEGEEQFRMDLRVLADFISVASRLIFLKSKYLLPGLTLTPEEEEGIKDLEERLKIYQTLKPAIKILNRLWQTSHKSYSRPYFLGRGIMPGQAVFYPGKELSNDSLRGALNHLFETIKTFELETETIKETIVSLEEKITEVLSRIEREGEMHFRSLSTNASRSEAIVVFLALLHLAREQLILIEQMDNFSDIMVKKNN